MSLPGSVPSQIRMTVSPPLAGADWSFQVPDGSAGVTWTDQAGTVWGGTGKPIWARLTSGYCTLLTSAQAAARWPGFHFADSGSNYLGAVSITTTPTGLTSTGFTQQLLYMRSFCWDSVGVLSTASDTGGVNCAAVIFLPGYFFGSSTPGLQTGDQYSSIELMMEVGTSQPIWDGGTVQTF